MPVGTYPIVPAATILGFNALAFAFVTSDAIAAWVGSIVIVSAGAATIVKNWHQMRREEHLSDCEERIKMWQESSRECEEIRRIERDRNVEAEKTMRIIIDDARSEIQTLRDAIAARDGIPKEENA